MVLTGCACRAHICPSLRARTHARAHLHSSPPWMYATHTDHRAAIRACSRWCTRSTHTSYSEYSRASLACACVCACSGFVAAGIRYSTPRTLCPRSSSCAASTPRCVRPQCACLPSGLTSTSIQPCTILSLAVLSAVVCHTLRHARTRLSARLVSAKSFALRSVVCVRACMPRIIQVLHGARPLTPAVHTDSPVRAPSDASSELRQPAAAPAARAVDGVKDAHAHTADGRPDRPLVTARPRSHPTLAFPLPRPAVPRTGGSLPSCQ